jgi:hypothetical protein
MLTKTTCIIQTDVECQDTIDSILKFIPIENILIYDDASSEHITNSDFRSEVFSGNYQDAFKELLPLVKTEFVVRVNGGDIVHKLVQPKKAGSIWLSKLSGCPDHEMDASRYPHAGTSIITGSVIPKAVYEQLMAEYPADATYKFGAYCGEQILTGNLMPFEFIKRSETISMDFKSMLRNHNARLKHGNY